MQQRCIVLEEQLVNLMIMSLRVCHATDMRAQHAKEAAATSGSSTTTATTSTTTVPTADGEPSSVAGEAQHTVLIHYTIDMFATGQSASHVSYQFTDDFLCISLPAFQE